MQRPQDRKNTELGVEQIKRVLEEIFARSHGWNPLRQKDWCGVKICHLMLLGTCSNSGAMLLMNGLCFMLLVFWADAFIKSFDVFQGLDALVVLVWLGGGVGQCLRFHVC